MILSVEFDPIIFYYVKEGNHIDLGNGLFLVIQFVKVD